MSESTSLTGAAAGAGTGAGSGTAGAPGLLRTRLGFSARRSSVGADVLVAGVSAASSAGLAAEGREGAAFLAGAEEGALAPEVPVDFGLADMRWFKGFHG